MFLFVASKTSLVLDIWLYEKLAITFSRISRQGTLNHDSTDTYENLFSQFLTTYVIP
jgi:hypothetical protein